MNLNYAPQTDSLARIITGAINSETARIVAEEAVEAGKRVEKRVRESAAGICATVVQRMSFEMCGTDLKVVLSMPPGRSR